MGVRTMRRRRSPAPSEPMPRRSQTRTLLLASTLCALAAGEARADFPRLGLYLGPYVGGNIVLNRWDFGPPGWAYYLDSSHGGVVGGRLGIQAHQRLFIEGEVAYVSVK